MVNPGICYNNSSDTVHRKILTTLYLHCFLRLRGLMFDFATWREKGNLSLNSERGEKSKFVQNFPERKSSRRPAAPPLHSLPCWTHCSDVRMCKHCHMTSQSCPARIFDVFICIVCWRSWCSCWKELVLMLACSGFEFSLWFCFNKGFYWKMFVKLINLESETVE